MKKIIIVLLSLTLSLSAAGEVVKRHHPLKKVATHSIKKSKDKAKRVIHAIANPSADILLYDLTNHSVIQGGLDTNSRAIASISKLMTVYTVVKDKQDMNEVLTIEDAKMPRTKLRNGMRIRRSDLIQLALVNSDNVAAHNLAIHGVDGFDNFIYRMNQNAMNLGMTSTSFDEATGLSPNNKSSINDLVLLLSEVSKHSIFVEAATSNYAIAVTHVKNRTVTIRSNPTSRFFNMDGIHVIKTGFTNPAGFCIAMIVEKNNRYYSLVVLGSRTSAERNKMVQLMLAQI